MSTRVERIRHKLVSKVEQLRSDIVTCTFFLKMDFRHFQLPIRTRHRGWIGIQFTGEDIVKVDVS